jgi:sugar phosphate isomerase/epimerase
MINRRDFIKQSSTLALGGLLLKNPLVDLAEIAKKRTMGVQLFTLFNTFDKDVKGNLQKVAAIGFKEIESAFSMKGGYYGMTAKEFAALIKETGLNWQSHHVGGAAFKPRVGAPAPPANMPKSLNLKENAQQVVDEVAGAGVKYLVCSSIPINTMEDVKESIEILNKAGEIAKKAGLVFAYHNHDREFKEVDGQKPYDMFLSQVSADLMKMELDLAWVRKAGVDPVELFKKHPKRFPLWHVKDMSADFSTIMPVGEGSIDFKRIFAEAKTAGLKHFFVEHDMPKNAFESITSSYKYLSGMAK